jgi:hypothetical protein
LQPQSIVSLRDPAEDTDMDAAFAYLQSNVDVDIDPRKTKSTGPIVRGRSFAHQIERPEPEF